MANGSDTVHVVALRNDRAGWRALRRIWSGCLLAIVVMSAVVSLRNAPSAAGAVVLTVFVALVGGFPILAALRPLRRGEGAVPYIEVRPEELKLHQPAFFGRAVAIPLADVHAVCLDELPGPDPPAEESVAPGRSRGPWWRRLDIERGWRPPIVPHTALPDVVSVSSTEPWDLLVVLRRPFFLGTSPRRSTGWLSYMGRGMFFTHAPERRAWVRGFMARVADRTEAAEALQRAGVAFVVLDADLVRWATRPPDPGLRDAWRFLRRRATSEGRRP